MGVAAALLAGLALVLVLAWPRRANRDETTARPAAPREAGGYATAERLRDALSRTPFGEALARRLWRRLEQFPDGEGFVKEFHPYFCGHALIRTAAGVRLCDAEDGGMSFGSTIAEWTDEDEFVAFFARQSDYSCSGWDPGEPVFATDDAWYRNNQRLTREALEGFVSRG